jgi:NADH-quinone oxidoreductase subunit L
MFRLFFVAFTGEPRDPHAYEHAHESPLSMTGPLVVLALLSICVGWLNWPGFDGYSKFLHYGNAAPAVFNWTLGWISLGISLLGIGLAACFYYFRVFSAEKMAERFRPLYLLLKNKYYFDEFYGWLLKKFIFGLAYVAHWFDENVVDDGMVDGTGWFSRKLGGLLTLTQTGYVQNYALVIFGAVAIIFLLVSF